jgi:REP element-mobilizing transposase RayT
MARRRRLFAAGLLYHVIARGNHREPTFLTDPDYQAYVTRLATYQKRYGVALYAYCLMPNHVHLLLQTSESPLAKFMQGVQQSYTQRFNRVHDKVGHLFQARYRAIVCEQDEYLLALIRYIHLNPVRAGMVADPEEYPYSGHRAYLGRDGRGLIDTGPVLTLLGGRDRYRRFVSAGIGAGHEARYYETEQPEILGARPFARSIGQLTAQPLGALPRTPLDMAVRELGRRFGVDVSILRSPDRSHRVTGARAAVSFILVRRLGYPLADVAAALGRDASTIAVMVSRLAGRLDHAVGAELSTEMFKSQSLTPG